MIREREAAEERKKEKVKGGRLRHGIKLLNVQ